MTERGPRARLHEFAGVGHAPTLVAPDQVEVVREFLPCRAGSSEDRSGAPAATAPIVHLLDPHEDGPRGGNAGARARLRRAAARRPRARHRRGRARPRRRRRRDPAPHRRGAVAAAPPPTWSMRPTTSASPRRLIAKAFGASQAASSTHARKLGAAAARRARRAARRRRARAADRARAEDAARLLARPARGAAAPGLAPADAALVRGEQAAVPAASSPPSRCRCSRRSPTGSASGRSSGSSRTWRSASSSPSATRRIARLLDETRAEREERVERLRASSPTTSRRTASRAEVQGRPKHLYSIWKKMRGRASISTGCSTCARCASSSPTSPPATPCSAACTSSSARSPASSTTTSRGRRRTATSRCTPWSRTTTAARSRSRSARRRCTSTPSTASSAHWAYKEADAALRRRQRRRQLRGAGRAGATRRAAPAARLGARSRRRRRAEEARRRDRAAAEPAGRFDDRIYVFTPQAAVVELAGGATPIDFAYAVHTDLGHRCRGARVDGAMVPLNTPLQSGQTVEVIAAKVGGPSLDWLNAELGYLQSARSKAKVRAWFNAQAQAATIARGREAVEKLLQREGRTALKLDDLAAQLGFRSADALFEVVGKDELSLRSIENAAAPGAAADGGRRDAAAARARRRRRPRRRAGGRRRVAADGAGALLPPGAARPDRGYVTRGRGVAVHRTDCSNFRQMAARAPERVIAVAWGAPTPTSRPLPGRRQRRGDRPAGPAARHLRGVRQGEDERHRRRPQSARRRAAAPRA